MYSNKKKQYEKPNLSKTIKKNITIKKLNLCQTIRMEGGGGWFSKIGISDTNVSPEKIITLK